MADEAVELMRERAERQGVTLETRYADDVMQVEGDRDRLNQVLINLSTTRSSTRRATAA